MIRAEIVRGLLALPFGSGFIGALSGLGGASLLSPD